MQHSTFSQFSASSGQAGRTLAPTFDKLRELARVALRAEIPGLRQTLYAAEAAGVLTEAQAEEIDALLNDRQLAPLDLPQARRRGTVGSRPRTAASLLRRRELAASRLVPGKVAMHYTQGENAALAVIARECKRHGCCALSVGQIAAYAGVCATTVRNAFRKADGVHLRVVRRKLSGRNNDTNVVTILPGLWSAWLGLGGRDQVARRPGQAAKGRGVQISNAHVPPSYEEGNRERESRGSEARRSLERGIRQGRRDSGGSSERAK